MEIRVADALEIPGPDVNTPEDLARAAERFALTPAAQGTARTRA
jgi:hypothetical protein